MIKISQVSNTEFIKEIYKINKQFEKLESVKSLDKEKDTYQIIREVIKYTPRHSNAFKKIIKTIINFDRIDVCEFLDNNNVYDIFSQRKITDIMLFIANYDRGNFFLQYYNKVLEKNISTKNSVLNMHYHLGVGILMSAIHSGCVHGMEEVIDKLIEEKNKSAKMKDNKDTEHEILRYIINSPNYKTVPESEFLLFKSIKEKYNLSVLSDKLDMAYRDFLVMSVDNRKPYITKYLIEEGVDVTKHNYEALKKSIKKDDVATTKVLLEALDKINKSLSSKQKYQYFLLAARNDALKNFQFFEQSNNIENIEVLKAAFKNKKNKKIQNYLLEKVDITKYKSIIEHCSKDIKPVLFNKILQEDLKENTETRKPVKKL